ncbi:hypothetical protein C0216_10000 [Streptomyces globosus]|uniref:Uncharacterized protein n=1 Tax=Streptomyces globosus TaxID=68209 RepID=A0A344TYN0_9ACTN|nr:MULTISPECIES: hypothetical protein [Streptomyces]AXE23751.1 hypothetical protein C0216_10000 [Streptomyces globosus]
MSDEPVFVRSRWGTSRYVYNHRNPVGLALIVITPLIALGVLFGLRADWTWGEGEFRDAVRKGVKDLEGARQYTTPESDHHFIVSGAVRDSGIGPGHGVHASKAKNGGYTVGTEDTETEYCVFLSLTRAEERILLPGAPVDAEALSRAGMPALYLSHATYVEGACR